MSCSTSSTSFLQQTHNSFQLNAQNEDLRATLVQQNAELAARLARLEEAAARAAT